jgi:lysophospholipase L1-like esterase
MTILLTQALRVGGVVLSSGTTQTFAADMEADIVARKGATYLTDPTPGKTVPVVATTDVAGGLRLNSGGKDPIEVMGTTKLNLINPSGLLRWRLARDNARNAVARINCVGDSTVAGIGCDGNNAAIADTVGDVGSWPAALRYLYAKKHGLLEQGNIKASDSRNVLVGSPVIGLTSGSIGNGYGGFAGGGAMNLPTGKTCTIVTPFACTAIDIIYYEGSGLGGVTTGAWQYNIDAAGNVAVPNAGGDTTKVVSLTGLANTTHSIVIGGTAATGMYLSGLQYHNGSGVLVTRQGQSSLTSGDLVGTGSIISTDANGQNRVIGSNYSTPAPKLCILYVGVNDAAITQTPLSTFKTNIQRIIDAVSAASGCTLLVGQPSAAVAYSPITQNDYIRSLAELAGVNAYAAFCAIQDVWSDYTTAYANGLYTTAAATVHHSQVGYSSVAKLLFDAIELV